MKDTGLPEPIFSTKGFFTDTFMKRIKPISANDGTLNGTLKGILNSTEQLVLNNIKSTPGITANALIQQSDKSMRTIRRIVKQLNEKGLIEYRGSKKTGGYYLNNGPINDR